MRVLTSLIVLSLAACTPQQPPVDPAATADAAPPVVVEPPHADPAPPVPPMTGGYAPADLEDANVKAAKMLAVDEIYKRAPTRALVEKVDAQQQVVAGMNYRFDITMTGGARFDVTVFHDLNGAMTVTDFTKLSP